MKTEKFKEFNIHKDSLRRCGLRKTDYCVSDPIQRRSTGVNTVRSFGKIPTDRNCTVNTTEGFSFIETEALKRTSIRPVILKASWKKKQSTEGQDRINTL